MIAPATKIVRKRLSSITPSPENDRVYGAVDPSDPKIIKLAEQIERHGLLEPIVVTKDGRIVSGHRRYAACVINEQQFVRCVVLAKRRDEFTENEFIELIVEYNRQRDKSIAVQVRETLIDHDPEDSYAVLKNYRQKTVFAADQNGIETLEIVGRKKRTISPSSAEHVNHIKQVIFEDRREYWPLSCRAVHYALFQHYDFLRSIQDGTKYENDLNSSKATAKLITTMRMMGIVPWEAIADETRPVVEVHPFQDVREFIKREVEAFCCGYWRDLQQSQPNHVEVLCEKNTIFNMVLQVTRPYQIVTSSGRGFGSASWLRGIYQRYRQSKKDRLVMVVLSDFDPSGQEIPQVIGRTMKEFGLRTFDIVQACVTRDQIAKYNLPSGGNANPKKDKRAPAFILANGCDSRIYELEALEPETMLAELDAVIRGVMDVEAYNHEVEQEEEESAFLRSRQEAAADALKGLLL